MAELSDFGKAVVEKVASILMNVGNMEKIEIVLRAEKGSVTQIRYNITENLIPTKKEVHHGS